MNKTLYEIRRHREDNERFLNIVNYHLAKRDFNTVISLLGRVGDFTKDQRMLNRVKGLFLLNNKAQEFFGIAENIVGSMVNIVFSGNVSFKIDDEEKQKLLDSIYFDGYFLKMIKELYETAITSNDGKAFLFMNTVQTYNNVTNMKIKDDFLNFQVFPSYEIRKEENKLIRTFYDMYEDEVYEFRYIYTVDKDGKTLLEVKGYKENENAKGIKQIEEVSEDIVKKALTIDTVVENFDFVPYEELDLGKGMIPHILWIENSLAENLYWQDVDLMNSQTHTYTPESFVYETLLSQDLKATFIDKYNPNHIIQSGGIDKEEIKVVEGKSAITNIERNLALNVIQACLDAKISPLSLGYSLIDKIASNTDVGIEKERVTIRLRENHIIDLKVLMAKQMVKLFKLYGEELEIVDIAVIFDQYITPSFESMVNVLAKAVQFGLISRRRAVMLLTKNELSEEEADEEYERIKEIITQVDYNVDQQKGIDNNLKSSGIEE